MWEEYAKIGEIIVNVYYCASTHSDRKWQVDRAMGVNEHFLKSFNIGKNSYLNIGIFKVFKNHEIWIIGGYSDITAQILIILCKLCRKPHIIIFDGVSPKKLREKENWLKFWWKKLLVNSCTAFLGNGSVGKLYAKKLGIPNNKIFNQFLTVDVKHFNSFFSDKEKIRKQIREYFGISRDSFIILYIGRLIKHKGVQDLIQAFKLLKLETDKNIYLLIVGFGNYENKLKQISSSVKEIIFVGNVDYEHIHEYYFSSDIFVLPTYNDPWGLVINEAMACGLPVITTTASGASLDLLKDGENGFVIEPGDIKQLKNFINLYLKNDFLLFKHSQKSLEIISKYTFIESKKELKKCLSKFQNNNV